MDNDQWSPTSTLDKVVGTTSWALRIAADVSGVPYVSQAVKLVEQIAKLALNVPRNKNQARQLSTECRSLCSMLADASEGVENPQKYFVGRLLTQFTTLLQEIEAAMNQWVGLGYWTSFARQMEISKNITTYGRRLNTMRSDYQIGVITKIGFKVEVPAETPHGTAAIHHSERCLSNNTRGTPGQDAVNQVTRAEEGPRGSLDTESEPYEESRQQDRLEAVLEFARSDFGTRGKELEDSFDKKEVENMSQALGQVMEDLNSEALNDAERDQLKRNLFVISEAVGQLPKSLRIPPEMLEYDNSRAVAGSNIYDIYKGNFLTQDVAIKKARSFACVEGYVKHILKEAKNWRSACEVDPDEEYILQLIGISFPEESCMMISRWMKDRDLLAYITRGDVLVDRKRMVLRIAKGLEILHSHNLPIAHGHLKASSIMVNHRGEPLLGDFGLSKSLKSITGHPITDIQGIQSFRWFAPELLGEEPLISTRSDIYSFGMTVLEVMTGEKPFREMRRASSIPEEVRKGKHPVQPTEPIMIERGLDDQLWALLVSCWAKEPSERPDIFEVNRVLERMWG